MILIANLCLTRKIKFIKVTRCQRWFSIFSEHAKLIHRLKSCTQTLEISQIHALMVKNGLVLQPFPLSKLLATAIVDIDYGAAIFTQVQNPNLFMFNIMLRGYSISQNPKQALFLFNTLRAQGISLDQFSFVCTLKSCTRVLAFGTGEAIHGVVVRSGFELFINVRNTLLHLYCAYRRIEDAHQLLDEFPQGRDLVSWNTLMRGYLHISQPTAVFNLFRQMRTEGLEVSTITVLSVLSACGDLPFLLGGEYLHIYCIKIGFCLKLNVVTAIISMYAKNGRMDYGRQVFDQVPKKDVVLWNCIIDGYAKNGLLEESLSLLRLMRLEEVKPNSATLAGFLSACASLGALAMGQCINKYVEEEQLELDAVLGTALIGMYSKCGFKEKARDVFDKMQSKDVRSWTAMITCYGVHGHGENAIQLFNKMEMEGMKPNEVTFLAVLNACSHRGLVTEGKNYFERMVRVYGFSPNIEHYGCMIDTLGRAGLLDEAYKLIKNLPVERDDTAWRTLLAACRVHGNVELGEIVKRKLELNNEHPTDLILLSSTYAVAGRWDDVARMRGLEEKMGVKETGCSSLEIMSKPQPVH